MVLAGVFAADPSSASASREPRASTRSVAELGVGACELARDDQAMTGLLLGKPYAGDAYRSDGHDAPGEVQGCRLLLLVLCVVAGCGGLMGWLRALADAALGEFRRSSVGEPLR